MLMLDSHRMPRATPDTAEKMVPIVSTTMIPSATVFPGADQPETISTPRPICRAPMPSEAAVPNSVAMIASPSIRRAPTESLRWESPNSGAMIELISGTRPRR